MTGVWVFWIVTGVLTVDAWRRERTQWVAADRNRGWWLAGLTVSSVMLLPAIFFVPGYLFGVLPAFGGNSGGSGRTRSNVDEFRRR